MQVSKSVLYCTIKQNKHRKMEALQQLQTAKLTIERVNDILNSGFDFESWERKEYESVLKDAKKEVQELVSLINDNFDVFGVVV